jgi:predicted GIY-YIG superfamily endonuclease
MYYVYILKCEGELLYTGITNDVSRRMDEHFGRSEKCAKFTRSHKAQSLEALWSCENRSLASKLEYRIKPRLSAFLISTLYTLGSTKMPGVEFANMKLMQTFNLGVQYGF